MRQGYRSGWIDIRFFKKKEFAMRVAGKIVIDTEKNPRRPAGLGVIRMIAVATFFVEPKDAL